MIYLRDASTDQCDIKLIFMKNEGFMEVEVGELNYDTGVWVYYQYPHMCLTVEQLEELLTLIKATPTS